MKKHLKRMLCGVVATAAILVQYPISGSYVEAESGGKNYYVSVNSGSDTNNGTTVDTPFQTIQQAADVARAGDTVYIMGGNYYETVTPKNSGESGKPITFKNYNDERVTISGTVPIEDSKWTQYKGNIYQVSASDIPGFQDLGEANQIFVNGDTMWEARWPNINAEYIGNYGLDALEASDANLDDADISDSGYTYKDESLKELANVNLEGATAWCRSGSAWVASSSAVTDRGNNLAQGQVNVDVFPPVSHNEWLHPRTGNDYYIFGALDLLDSPGEWFLNADGTTLYLYAPDGGKPSKVTMKSRLNAFNLKDKSYIHVQGLSVLGATIEMDGANDCVLDNMDMQWIYYSMDCKEVYEDQNDKGLNITGHRNVIQNSTLAYGTGSAILLSGNDNRVINNNIHDFNFIGSYATGVTLKGQRSLISHNSIHAVGRSAIQLDGYADIIEYNDIYNTMWRSTDGGALYTFGNDGGNTEIRYNVIHDSKSSGDSRAIYLDNFIANYIVHHNVVYNPGHYATFISSPSNYVMVYNNTFLGGQGYWGQYYYDEGYGNHYFNNIYTGNMTIQPDAEQGYNLTGTTPAFENAGDHNYQLSSSATNAIDQGIIIRGVTESYTGTAPDLGAYEYGEEPWKAGHNFENPPTVKYAPSENLQYSNIVKNACFDLGMESWTAKEGQAEVEEFNQEEVTHLKRGHLYKLRIGDNENGGTAEVVQILAGLQPNTTYKLSGWVYTTGEEEAIVGVRNYGSEEIVQSEPYKGEYKRSEIVFSTGDTTTAEIYIKKTTDGANFVYADDFGVQYVSEAFRNMVEKDSWIADAYDNRDNANYAIDSNYNSAWSDQEGWGVSEIDVGSASLNPLKEITVMSGLSGISVTWDAINHGETYNVYRKTGEDGEFSLVAGKIDRPYYRDNDVKKSENYCYAVSRVYEEYESAKIVSEFVTLVNSKNETIDFELNTLDEFFEVPNNVNSTIGQYISGQTSEIVSDEEKGKVWHISKGTQGACAMYHAGNYSDVVLTADMKLASSVRVSLRNDGVDGDRGYSYNINSGSVRICKRTEDYMHDSDLITAPMPVGFNANEWHRYEFRVEGYTISLFVDGQEIVSVTDESEMFTSGGFVFGGWFADAYIDNIHIEGTETVTEGITSNTLIDQNDSTSDITSFEKATAMGSQWFTVDMKRQNNINRVKAYFKGEAAMWEATYTVLLSDNGRDWYMAAKEVKPGTTGVFADFDAVSAQYIRIVKEEYSVTVENGMVLEEDAFYESGATVTVKANPAPEGKLFDRWTSSDGVTFADESQETTTFKMPARAVTVTATYKDKEKPDSDNDEKPGTDTDGTVKPGTDNNTSGNQNKPSANDTNRDDTVRNDSETPDTGDSANGMLWIVLIVVSVAGIVILGKKKISGKVFRI